MVAIGDDTNDTELIRNSGLGIAMGNAADVVKQAADEITTRNTEDGVAVAIERHLFSHLRSAATPQHSR
jgi:hydroxymethylpyrimidine pyrophosphatase-like HAD family hydrolase